MRRPSSKAQKLVPLFLGIEAAGSARSTPSRIGGVMSPVPGRSVCLWRGLGTGRENAAPCPVPPRHDLVALLGLLATMARGGVWRVR